jgi:hypothetical protein
MRRTLGALFVVAPFVAAAIAAGGARRDPRLAAMAVVSTVTVWLLLRVVRRSFAGVLLAFGLATVAGVGVALIAGARAPFGVVAVAIVVAAFASTGRLLLRH